MSEARNPFLFRPVTLPERPNFQENPSRETLATPLDVFHYLRTELHREDLCSEYTCDPWKLEPVLIDALHAEQSKRDLANPERIMKLRKLIRAGSWPSYPELGKSTPESALANIQRHLRLLQRRVDDLHVEARSYQRAGDDHSEDILATIPHAIAQKDALEPLDQTVLQSIQHEQTGNDAERATRAIELLVADALAKLQQLAANHGISLKEASMHPAGRALGEDIVRFRQTRDWIYFARCYPKRANVAYHEWRKQNAADHR